MQNIVEALPKSSSLKILYLIPDTKVGGAQRNLVHAANTIGRIHTVRMVVLKKTGPLDKEIDRNVVTRVILGMRSWHDLRSLVRLSRIVKSFEPDVVHSQLFLANTIARAMKATRQYRGAVIAGERTADFSPPWKSPLLRWLCAFLDKLLYRFSDVILTNNDQLPVNFGRRGYDIARIAVVRNGIDTSCYTPPVPSVDGAIATICFCGRLEKAKNLSYALAEFATLHQNYHTTRFRLIGGGSQMSELKNQARELGIEERVVFEGEMEPWRALEAIKDAAICILPSIYEGLSNSLLEYGALAKPVVVSDIPGNRLVVKDERYGYLFDLNRPGAIEQKIAEALNDYAEALRKGASLRKRVTQEFSVHRMCQATEQIYREVSRRKVKKPECLA
ncbi:MAG: glycosyltransferase [Chitinivibrionales bacterium]|nr:glycosyltransferase [Chitinivibrionales bacterium]